MPSSSADHAHQGASVPTRHGRLIQNVEVPMRDGTLLRSTVALPPGDGPFPVVLVRTAYSRASLLGTEFSNQGIAFMVQDCRGRYGSDGEFYPFLAEGEDGWDTLEWITAQPWCNGRVGMFGDSYLAATQLHLAPKRHPALVALNPRFMSGDVWMCAYYRGGAFSLALTYSWLCFEVASRTSNAGLLPSFDVSELLRELPLLTLDEKAGCGLVKAWRDYVSHHTRDDFWKRLCTRDRAAEFRAPVLLTGGWYDYYAGETFANYTALVERAHSQTLARSHRVIVGPWTHGINPSTRLGQLDFGPEVLGEKDSTTRWLKCILGRGDPEEFQAAPIRIFVMGANQWRDEHEWPLARTRFTEFYLDSSGSANTLGGEGFLSMTSPRDGEPDRYSYDPENPVPTLGGNHSVGPYNPGLYELALPGPYDQRPVESREDVLVYTTDPMGEDMEVTGPVAVRLFASTSARDTDFVARLTDVYPDGRSINITEGVIRARFREGNWEHPRAVEPGRVLEYEVELMPTSNVFARGHRLRLDLTSSSFPLWDRNLNTGLCPATGTEMRVAEQAIYHEPGHASRLILPVIP